MIRSLRVRIFVRDIGVPVDVRVRFPPFPFFSLLTAKWKALCWGGIIYRQRRGSYRIPWVGDWGFLWQAIDCEDGFYQLGIRCVNALPLGRFGKGRDV